MNPFSSFHPLLYPLCDSSAVNSHSYVELAQLYLEGGAKILQLRMKGSSPQEYKKVAIEILELKNKYDFCFVVNDHLNIAVELEVDALHIGKKDGKIVEAKEKIGPKKILGYSSHSIEEAVQAAELGADYIAFGAIFPTQNKGPFHPLQGTLKLKSLIEQIQKPVVAIGGINWTNLDEVLKTGVHSFAMIQALSSAEHPQEEVKKYSDYAQKFKVKK